MLDHPLAQLYFSGRTMIPEIDGEIKIHVAPIGRIHGVVVVSKKRFWGMWEFTTIGIRRYRTRFSAMAHFHHAAALSPWRNWSRRLRYGPFLPP